MNFLIKRKNIKLSNNLFLKVPDEIISLLWIEGITPITIKKETQRFQYGNVVVEFSYTGHDEPSIINKSLLITPCSNPLPLGYYPSYNALDACQKFSYLKWLSDITQPTEIGNVFIFYYGLERHLFSDKFELALETINTLRKHHTNNSFMSYSSQSIIFSCLYHDRVDLFNKLDVELQFSQLYSFVKLLLTGALSISDIISSSSFVGFKNRRYLNLYPKMFEEELKLLVEQKFNSKFYNVSKSELKNSPIVESCIFANISLLKDEKSIRIYDIFENTKIKSDLFNLLQSTHNIIKDKLKSLRKQGISIEQQKPKPISKKKIDMRVYKSEEDQAMQRIDESKDNIDLHFAYMTASEFYYKHREFDGNIEKSELYANYDIKLFPNLYEDLLGEFNRIPSLPSFNRLTIILEKANRIEEAIKICLIATKFTNESEKEKFEKKLLKLRKKLPHKQISN